VGGSLKTQWLFRGFGGAGTKKASNACTDYENTIGRAVKKHFH
jgi:hypothetical protein